jgi:hypothetical protein
MSQLSNSTVSSIATNVVQPPVSCESEHENAECQHKTRLLVGLQINGIVFDQAAVEGNSNLLPSKNKKVWKPSVDSCDYEIKRRKLAMGMGARKYSNRRQTKAMKYLWLVENPVEEESDVTYVTEKIEEMVEMNRAAQEEKDMQNKVHWTGLEPFIRFIHCLCDFDEIRQAFKTSLACMTRIELDGKRNKEIAREDPW